MIKLNLTANGIEQTRIKQYLEENASENLAEKINNGTLAIKDGNTLLNKKDLDGFLQFACEEAQKNATKGAKSACIADETVFGWAIHYFEEESIIGTLYNPDGTKYESPKPKVAQVVAKPQPPKKNNAQATLFDTLLDSNDKQPEKTEVVEENIEVQEPDNVIIDKTTGEVLTPEKIQPKFENMLSNMLGINVYAQ